MKFGENKIVGEKLNRSYNEKFMLYVKVVCYTLQ